MQCDFFNSLYRIFSTFLGKAYLCFLTNQWQEFHLYSSSCQRYMCSRPLEKVADTACVMFKWFSSLKDKQQEMLVSEQWNTVEQKHVNHPDLEEGFNLFTLVEVFFILKMLTVVQIWIKQDYWLKLLWRICKIWYNLNTKVATKVTILLQFLPACKHSWIFFLEIEVTIIQVSPFVQWSWLLHWITILAKIFGTLFHPLGHFLIKDVSSIFLIQRTSTVLRGSGGKIFVRLFLTVKCWFLTVSM